VCETDADHGDVLVISCDKVLVTPTNIKVGTPQTQLDKSQTTADVPMGGHVNILSNYKKIVYEKHLKCLHSVCHQC